MTSAAGGPTGGPSQNSSRKSTLPSANKSAAAAKAKSVPASAEETKPVSTKPKTTKPVKKSAFNFFASEASNVDVVDEATEKSKLGKILRIVQLQALVIAGLGAFFVFGSPMFEPVYQYYALDSNHQTTRLIALTKPNMTNQAVLSWATNSITEIMTFGFGDYVPHLRSQQTRFTPEGWKGFVAAFDKMQLGKTFRDRQLVLTTVPSDTAVILSQGPTPQHVYEWKVQMPVVMTYATNDNITHRDHAVIELTISRVDPNENPSSIAIKNWTVHGN